MKKSMLITTILVMAISSFAQSFGEIKGRIIDKVTGEPIMYASVYVEQGSSMIGGTTDDDGRFRIKPLGPGTYDLNVKSLEYADIVHQGVVVKTNEITVLPDLFMAGSMLDPVVISTYTDELITFDDPSKMSISAPDLVKRADVRDTQSLITNLIPGITQSNGPTKELHFRGARPQNFATFIDGVRIGGGVIPNVPSNAISNLTVYTGGIPASYGDVTGGVIIIETKSYFDFYRASERRKMSKSN